MIRFAFEWVINAYDYLEFDIYLTDAQKAVGDLTGDGEINATDALQILKIAVGKA